MKDSQDTDKIENQESAQPPEDVAVLYSWANMHGARYRDFSDSRREYREQLRQRAAEQLHEQATQARSEAKTAADSADAAVRRATQAAQAAQLHPPDETETIRQETQREAENAARNAAAERLEAARRAEAAAAAEAAARRGERELAEAHAAAQRQADRYADAEIRQKNASVQQSHPSLEEVRPIRYRRAEDFAQEQDGQAARRPKGYRPDNASGVKEIYRGGVTDENARAERERRTTPVGRQEFVPTAESMYADRPSAVIYRNPAVNVGQRRTDQGMERRVSRMDKETHEESPLVTADPGFAARRDDLAQQATVAAQQRGTGQGGHAPQAEPAGSVLTPRGRRAQDDFDYTQAAVLNEPLRRPVPEPPQEVGPFTQRAQFASEPAGPAWLYAPPSQQAPPKPKPSSPVPPQPSVAETLQHSRERVASRWFALKGVFEQPGQELPEAIPVRQKETRTPVLAVFSLAGGVGKTSLVATVGRTLSSLGEKVLLTDTTSHGLLPFYFGASELRPDTVRTFSPPSGSTDAPIYLVSHDIEQKGCDDAAQERLAEEIANNSRGTHRILLDLTSNSGWIAKRMARMGPTVLVPLAPDMNSVISLQAVERYFQGLTDADGRPVQPYYVLNQFDTSLPLHLDVREVLRRQLGDRLLPFVIRHSPTVSEALAEGMTVVDYAPDAPVAQDYMNLATWLRSVAAPAAAGFRNVRWSER